MPHLQIPDKLARILTTTARFIVLIGGRSSAKSESVARILVMKAQTEAADILCGREYQNSIDESVHKLIKVLIENKIKVEGFRITDKKIDCLTGGGFRFKGFARNSEAVKSAQDFKYSWVEEAQSISQQSLDDLLPTIRAVGSKLFFTANPQSSADPFSKRFIVPYLRELKINGYYEDELHLIIMVNWRDNPWHDELEKQRRWDFKHLTRAKYDHVWEGEFNDSVEDPLILAEWFDACIDAHKVLGFQPLGAKMAAHDPSDIGPDNKGYAYRHGSIVFDLKEKTDGNVNEGGDWALGLATNQVCDNFTWDCDGLGVGLNLQVEKAFKGKHTRIAQFKGSESVDFPDVIYSPAERIQDQKTNKHAFKNKRAQYYFYLRDRMIKTFNAVNGAYSDPDELISFDSSILLLPKLRSELCRLPIKPNPNGMFTLYTKEELKTKFKYNSPNLADPTMMLMRQPYRAETTAQRPQPIRPMGIR